MIVDLPSALLVINLLSSVLGGLKEVSELVDRVKAGEKIEDWEIKEAQKSVKAAVEKWDEPKVQ